MSKKKFRFPDSMILIFSLVVIGQILTYILPAGEFDRKTVKGKEVVVPGSYHVIPEDQKKSVSMFACLEAIPKGMAEASDIIFFVFIIGGALGIIKSTGAINALIGTVIKRLGKTPFFLIAGSVVLFALGSSSIGMAEEYVPFIPLLVTMCIALRMDAVVAVGLVYVGAGVGYGCAAINPFTVLIAQDIAGVPATSGQWYRWILLVVFLMVGIHHILRYASKINKNSNLSLVKDVDYSNGFEMPEDVRFTWPRIAVLTAFVCAIILFVYGVWKWEWYLTEMSALFLGLGLLAAIISGITPNQSAKEFAKGAGELTTAALLIGFAKAIKVVMDDGMITDTVINSVACLLEDLPTHASAVCMLLFQSVCNFFIPSGSGQAYVTMPLMAPLATLTGVTKQTAVLAYQFGDGFTNMIIPTNALLMGMLALGRISYSAWLRFIAPLLLKIYLMAILALIIAVIIEYK